MMDESMTICQSDRQLISNLAQKIVRHGMAIPAIFFLDMVKYLSFFGGQLMVFFGPIITVFFPSHSYYKIAELLEDRKNVEFLFTEIERLIKGTDIAYFNASIPQDFDIFGNGIGGQFIRYKSSLAMIYMHA